MDRLYRTIKDKARGCRDRDIRIKIELFLLAIRLRSVKEACERRGFSRRFYYRWWNRFKKSHYDLGSLEEYSRRPRRSPNQISEKLEKRIFWYRRRQYGARMIEAFLNREGIQISRSTISHVLRKRRLKAPKKRSRLNLHNKRYELVVPCQRMQMDVKYVPELVGGKKAYCYVIIDECTRWRFAQVFDQLAAGTTVAFLKMAKLACPFPIHAIQTDNGQEFTYSLIPFASHVKHPMDEWCEQNRIKHRLIPPGVKELNGKVERSHRIDEQYFYWRASTISLVHINHQLARWIGFYNTQRPHGGLNYLTPREKLEERVQTLQKPPQEPWSEALECLRLRFIHKTPKSLAAEDLELLLLESEIETLLKAG